MHTLSQDIDNLDTVWYWKHSNVECCDFSHMVQDDLDKLLSGEKTFADPKIISEGKKWKH
jgi:hypothetical protein